MNTNDASVDKIRIIIVDDDPGIRENLRKLLQCESDLEVVGTASNGFDGWKLAKGKKPDIVLMNINMPEMDGIEATERITKEVPRAQVVMLSVQSEPEYLLRAMLAGARFYLTKPISADDLYMTIRRVYERRQPEEVSPPMEEKGHIVITEVTVASREELPKPDKLARRFDAAFPGRVKVGDTVSLCVGVLLPDAPSPFGDLEPESVVRKGETVGGPFPIDPQTGEPQEVVLDLMVDARGFEPGTHEESLRLNHEDEPATAEVPLKAVEEGECGVTIIVWWQDEPLGSLSLPTEVLSEDKPHAAASPELAFGSFYLVFSLGAA
jgi:DNA-binding NarL/FixJ family response regulator